MPPLCCKEWTLSVFTCSQTLLASLALMEASGHKAGHPAELVSVQQRMKSSSSM